MRLCHRAGHVVPLLTITAFLAGCATSTTDQPPNFNSNPQVVAVYAVDSAFGSLPDVLVYSTASGDQGKTDPNPPPSYGSYRVEFDQPVNGTTVANNADRGPGPDPGGAASFCSPLTTNPLQLLDVEAGNRVVTSSICYDATSPLGSHPHVLIIPGRDEILQPAGAKPSLTCNTFRPDSPGRSDDLNIFKPNHSYAIKLNPATIQNGAGKALTSPSGAGWANDTFTFKTSGLKILAAGLQDANTGFFVWLDKPDPGFEKDLAPCATTSTCPDENDNNVLPTFEKPADSSPFFIVLSESVGDASGVTLRRADGSDPQSGVTTAGAFIGDPRIVEANVGATATGTAFEPGVTYNVSVPADLTALSGDTLGTPKLYTFTTQAGNAAKLATAPANGAQAQNHATVNVTVEHDNVDPTTGTAKDAVPVTTTTLPTIQFTVPVAASSGTTPVGTFTLKDPNGAVVPTTAAIRGARNNEFVRLTPTVPLIPETTYTVSWSGVKAAAVPAQGAAIPDGSTQFTTATFRMAILDDPTKDTAASDQLIADNGVVIPGATVVTVNLDRRVDVEPSHVKDGNLRAVFNSTAAGVDANSLVLSELSGTANTVTAIPNFTVTDRKSVV